MKDSKYLTCTQGLWHYRRRVPDDCKSLFNDQKILMRSLGTHNIREARLARNQMTSEMDRMIQEHRKDESSITNGQHYRSLITDHLSSDPSLMATKYSQLSDKLDILTRDKVITPDLSHLANKLPAMSQNERQRVVNEETQKAYVAQISDPDERLRAMALQNAYLGVRHDLVKISLNEALEQHMEDNGPSLKINTQTQVRKAVSRFLETFGKQDIALEAIGRKMVRDFIKTQLQERSGSTVKNYVTFISGAWKHAKDLELVEGDNPFADHKIVKGETESFQLFETGELTAIFKATEQYKGSVDDYKYLLPRLGYVTGARIEELCSLKCEQIVTDKDSGIVYLEILVGKTDNAKRLIPLHDWIVDDVKDQLQKVGTGYLFPTLTTQRNDGKRGDKVSKWFGRLKKTIMISDKKTGFHSFRVHVATNLERGRVLESTAVWVLGHTRSLTLSYGLYSKGMDISQLKEAIDVIPIDDAW